ITPAPLQLGQAPSELALNSAGFTPLAFANALRIGSSSPVYVAGSGKSSLVHGSIPAPPDVVSIDQRPIRGAHRRKPALSSANSEGACPNCNGAGVIYTDLAMMAGVATTCEECEGKRFEASVLDHHLA